MKVLLRFLLCTSMLSLVSTQSVTAKLNKSGVSRANGHEPAIFNGAQNILKMIFTG